MHAFVKSYLALSTHAFRPSHFYLKMSVSGWTGGYSRPQSPDRMQVSTHSTFLHSQPNQILSQPGSRHPISLPTTTTCFSSTGGDSRPQSPDRMQVRHTPKSHSLQPPSLSTSNPDTLHPYAPLHFVSQPLSPSPPSLSVQPPSLSTPNPDTLHPYTLNYFISQPPTHDPSHRI